MKTYENFINNENGNITLSKDELYEFMNDITLLGVDKSNLWKERSKEIFEFITDYNNIHSK